jgi:hypothetical protein
MDDWFLSWHPTEVMSRALSFTRSKELASPELRWLSLSKSDGMANPLSLYGLGILLGMRLLRPHGLSPCLLATNLSGEHNTDLPGWTIWILPRLLELLSPTVLSNFHRSRLRSGSRLRWGCNGHVCPFLEREVTNSRCATTTPSLKLGSQFNDSGMWYHILAHGIYSS